MSPYTFMTRTYLLGCNLHSDPVSSQYGRPNCWKTSKDPGEPEGWRSSVDEFMLCRPDFGVEAWVFQSLGWDLNGVFEISPCDWTTMNISILRPKPWRRWWWVSVLLGSVLSFPGSSFYVEASDICKRYNPFSRSLILRLSSQNVHGSKRTADHQY